MNGSINEICTSTINDTFIYSSCRINQIHCSACRISGQQAINSNEIHCDAQCLVTQNCSRCLYITASLEWAAFVIRTLSEALLVTDIDVETNEENVCSSRSLSNKRFSFDRSIECFPMQRRQIETKANNILVLAKPPRIR